jgi:hypothetical protein
MSKNNDAVMVVDGSDPIYVTPDDPLVINETVVNFTEVVIQGGEINVMVNTRATFGTLTKDS